MHHDYDGLEHRAAHAADPQHLRPRLGSQQSSVPDLPAQLQLIVRQLLGTATEAMAEQALDQHPELIVLSVQFTVLLRRRGHDIPQHLLQEFRIVRQSLEIADAERGGA